MDQESQKELLEFYEDEYSRENSTIEDMLNDFRADRDYILHQCYPNAYEELLKEYIEQILSSTGGDKEKAAETLKVNLSTLYRKLSDDKGSASGSQK